MHKICRYLLDENKKKWYDGNMESTIEINRKIANNLMHYRKAAGLTQAELAEKISYSDKSVSKWESGNGVPDIYTLMQLAELYGVTVDTLLGEGVPVAMQKKTAGLQSLIMLLSSGIVWLVATCFFVLMQLIFSGGPWWLAFLYAIPINAVVLLVFAVIWKYRMVNFVCVSTIIWTTITCLVLTINIAAQWRGTGDGLNSPWILFFLGIPLQVLEILWVFFRSLFRKSKRMLIILPRSKKEEERKRKK